MDRQTGSGHLSYQLDVQSGPAIVLTGAVLFACVFAVTGRRGLRRTAPIDALSGAR